MKEVNLSMSEMMDTIEFMNLSSREKYLRCLLYPGENISVDQQAACSFLTLVHPPCLDTDPYWKTNLGMLVLSYVRNVVGGFLRAEVSKEFPLWQLPRQPKEGSYQIKAEVELWISTWELITKLNIHMDRVPSIDYPVTCITEFHPILCLMKLAVECALILPTNYDGRVLENKEISIKKTKLGEQSTTRTIRILQSQNRELRNGYENPFDKRKTYTYELISKAMAFVGDSNDFRSGEWETMIRSREKLVKILREGECSNGVKREHRGRSKRVSE
jgi:hypothetical protein